MHCRKYHTPATTYGQSNFSVVPAMNLMSKLCIAVSATQKLNCVAVGVTCVAVFWCILKKIIHELRNAFPAEPVQGILKKERWSFSCRDEVK